MSLSIIERLSFMLSLYDSFTQLVTLHFAPSNPLTNTLPVLLKIPGSKHVYYLHFHDSTLPVNLAVNNVHVVLTRGIAIQLAVVGTVNRKDVLIKYWLLLLELVAVSSDSEATSGSHSESNVLP